MKTYTPDNIQEVNGLELPSKLGGSIRASLRPDGEGWDVMSLAPPDPQEKSDRMIPIRYVSENIGVWQACKLLNEEAEDATP